MSAINFNFLTISFLGVSVLHWCLLLGTFFGSIVISRVLAHIINKFIFHFFKSFKFTDAQKLQFQALSFVQSIHLVLVGWFIILGISLFSFPEHILGILIVAVKIITYVGVVWVGWKISDLVEFLIHFKASKTVTKFDDLLAPLVCRTLKTVFVIIGLLSISEILKLPLASLLAGLGIGGIAIAMAAKDTIANIFGSVTVLVDRPFNIGDWIKVDGIEGTVIHLGFRSTRIRTFYDSIVTVPNSILLTAVVDNFGERSYRRYKCHLDVVYDTTSENVDIFCQRIRDIIGDHPHMSLEKSHVYMTDFGPSSLKVLVYTFFRVADWSAELQAKHEFNLSIKTVASELGISFAYPSHSVYFENSLPSSENSLTSS